VFAIEFAGTRWSIRMRVVPAYNVNPHFPRLLLRHLNIARSYLKTIARRIIPPIRQWKQLDNFAGRFAIPSQHCATTLVRICLHAVRLNSPNQRV
jgi:hypothetical protein